MRCRCRSRRSGRVRRPPAACSRPRRSILESLQERSDAPEVSVFRDERDALLAARRGNQRVIEQRWILGQQLPSLPSGDGRNNATALDESGGGRCERAPAPFEQIKYSPPQVADCFSRPRAGGQLLHHNGAEEHERECLIQKGEYLRLRFVAAKAVDENIRVERVFHALRRPSIMSSTPPLRRTAAKPRASSSPKVTKSSAWSIASVSVSTPKARRAASSFR